MLIRILTFRYSPTLGGFDDGPLQELQRTADVLSCTPHFFSVAEVPHLTCVVSWQEAPITRELAAATAETVGKCEKDSGRGKGKRTREDPTAGLDEVDRKLFETLRRWRSEVAREEGAPPYVILTNRELLAVVKTKPESPTALAAIEGIGKAKVKRHGERLLRALHGVVQATGENAGSAPEKEPTAALDGELNEGDAASVTPTAEDAVEEAVT